MDQQRIYTLILTVPCIVIPETQFICHPPACYSPELFIEGIGGSDKMDFPGRDVPKLFWLKGRLALWLFINAIRFRWTFSVNDTAFR
jgi:hypothetical protein